MSQRVHVDEVKVTSLGVAEPRQPGRRPAAASSAAPSPNPEGNVQDTQESWHSSVGVLALPRERSSGLGHESGLLLWTRSETQFTTAHKIASGMAARLG